MQKKIVVKVIWTDEKYYFLIQRSRGRRTGFGPSLILVRLSKLTIEMMSRSIFSFPLLTVKCWSFIDEQSESVNGDCHLNLLQENICYFSFMCNKTQRIAAKKLLLEKVARRSVIRRGTTSRGLCTV